MICLDNYHRNAAWAGMEYNYVTEGRVDASVQNGSPFSVRNQTIGGKEYTVIGGTPSRYDVGSSYQVSMGSDSWVIDVYEPETSAPVADFDIEIGSDGFTVVAMFKGRNASFYTYDFNGDGIPESGNGFTYPASGRYTIVCKAVNNISETSCSRTVLIDIAPSEKTDVLRLTDFEMLLGEKQDIILSISDGDVITVSGSASGFVKVNGNVLRIEPTSKGMFDLTVKVHRNDGTSSSKTVKLTVRGSEIQDLEDEKRDYMVMMAVFFVISVAAISAFILKDIRPTSGNGRSPIRRFLDRTKGGRSV